MQDEAFTDKVIYEVNLKEKNSFCKADKLYCNRSKILLSYTFCQVFCYAYLISLQYNHNIPVIIISILEIEKLPGLESLIICWGPHTGHGVGGAHLITISNLPKWNHFLLWWWSTEYRHKILFVCVWKYFWIRRSFADANLYFKIFGIKIFSEARALPLILEYRVWTLLKKLWEIINDV